jgi:hypothetical protein
MKSSPKNDYITEVLAKELIPGDVIVGFILDAGTTDPMLVQAGPEIVVSLMTEAAVSEYIDITTLYMNGKVSKRYYTRKCPFRIYER